jgi:uncharacterized protein
MKRDVLGWITIILVIIGAINWGLVGAASINVVELIFGTIPWLLTTVYVLVGLAGIWEIILLFK